MSTAVDSRRRPSLWSYISFSSSSRRRSVSLPTRNNHHDPYEKADRHSSNGSANRPIGAVENIKEAWMTQSQRSRYLKSGGIIAFFVFLFFFLSPYRGSNLARGRDYLYSNIKTKSYADLVDYQAIELLMEALLFQIRRSGQRSARSPTRQINL